MEKEIEGGRTVDSPEGDSNVTQEALINASGHHQELDRNFHLINIAGLGVTSGNTWMALGGSIVCPNYLNMFDGACTVLIPTQVVAIYDGGPPGVIYEL